MKNLLLSFAAGLAGAAVALLLYQHFVLQPREQLIQQEVERHVAARVEQLRRAGEETADAIARSVDESRSEREAVRASVETQKQRAAIAAGLSRVAMFKLAVSESYLSMGQWPTSIEQIGLPPDAGAAGGGLRGIELLADGVLRLDYDEAVGEAASIRLTPTANAGTGSIDWRCEGSGFRDPAALPDACR